MCDFVYGGETRKNILVVDDDKMNLAIARKVLSEEYKVIPVAGGSQALEYLANNTCDIILLDINMPEMSGFEVLEKFGKWSIAETFR